MNYHKQRLTLKDLLSRSALLLLLVLYSAAALKINSFHRLFHSAEAAELHSPEQENDPCHQSIYHQQRDSGCEHKSHISENEKCPLCEYNPSSDSFVFNTVSNFTCRHVAEQPDFLAVQTLVDCHLVLSLRGPPALV